MYLRPTLTTTNPFPMSVVPFTSSTNYVTVEAPTHSILEFESEEGILSRAADLNRAYKLMDDVDLVSDTYKTLFVFKDNQIYHFFVDFVVPLYEILNSKPENHEFIIWTCGSSNETTYNKFLDFLILLLQTYNANYRVLEFPIDARIYRTYKINNYRQLRTHEQTTEDTSYTLKDLNDMSNSIRSVYGTAEPSTGKHVYVSRSSSSANYTHNGKKYEAPRRVSVAIESAIEEFLASNGFVVVNPEIAFSSIEEQINFMSDASILVAPSGSGLTNLLFMKDGGLVVELATEIEKPSMDDSAPFNSDKVSWYSSLSYAKHHSYLAIELTEDLDYMLFAIKSIMPLIKQDRHSPIQHS